MRILIGSFVILSSLLAVQPVAAKSTAKAKKIKIPKEALPHPHIEMMQLRLIKFVPPSEDKLVRNIDTRFTGAASGVQLRAETTDFLVRVFMPEALVNANMPDIAAMMKTLPEVNEGSARGIAEDLAKIQKRALSSPHKNNEVRLAMVGMIAKGRSMVTRVASEKIPPKISKEQLYTRDSFEADKMGDDLLKIFRFTIDADIDEMLLAPLLNRHVRTQIVKYRVEPKPIVLKAGDVKKKSKKKR